MRDERHQKDQDELLKLRAQLKESQAENKRTKTANLRLKTKVKRLSQTKPKEVEKKVVRG